MCDVHLSVSASSNEPEWLSALKGAEERRNKKKKIKNKRKKRAAFFFFLSLQRLRFLSLLLLLLRCLSFNIFFVSLNMRTLLFRCSSSFFVSEKSVMESTTLLSMVQVQKEKR